MNKHKNSTLQGEFKSVIAERALELVSVDLFGPLPAGQHNWQIIVVCMDVFTKYTRLYPSTGSTTEHCLMQVQKFVDEYRPMGKVETILSDNGRQFIAGGWVDHWGKQGIKTRLTSYYHPQANPVETRMKVIGDCLRTLCPTEHRKWSFHLKTIERRLNETAHQTTGVAPATLFHGIKFGVEGHWIRLTPEEWQLELKKAKETTKKQLERRKAANQPKVITEFQEGDQVLVKNFKKSNQEAGTTKKMNPIYKPATIVARHGNSYEIEKPSGKTDTHHIINLHHLARPRR